MGRAEHHQLKLASQSRAVKKALKRGPMRTAFLVSKLPPAPLWTKVCSGGG